MRKKQGKEKTTLNNNMNGINNSSGLTYTLHTYIYKIYIYIGIFIMYNMYIDKVNKCGER